MIDHLNRLLLLNKARPKLGASEGYPELGSEVQAACLCIGSMAGTGTNDLGAQIMAVSSFKVGFCVGSQSGALSF